MGNVFQSIQDNPTIKEHSEREKIKHQVYHYLKSIEIGNLDPP